MIAAKIICILLFWHSSFEQSDLNVEIGGGEKDLTCSNDIGKMDFTLNYTRSSLIDELKSYFILKFQDPSKLKYYSICKLSIEIEPSTNIEKPTTYIEETTNKLKPSTHIEKTTNAPKPSKLIESTINHTKNLILLLIFHQQQTYQILVN